ncbi:hypothetical protein TNCV_1818511 [Trichonephila clavipes]|nr:hypothetical protein TNCV_1818511 [Trichonephila clavipes]
MFEQISSRAASPLQRLLEGKERWEASNQPQGRLPQNWGGTKQNRTTICLVLKAKSNHRRENLALAEMTLVDLQLILQSIRWHNQQHHALRSIHIDICHFFNYYLVEQ